ncbi:hypothetical protein Salat_0334200 [Sesamum alatum]|uniref:Uncharacterized protein n=1 Tax=Sesamum alatum TaxID=300844 RepID=A0AAE1Z263_9LAMI|nr:hypothetical protein Salat_0334200 [Sesamum alatum]
MAGTVYLRTNHFEVKLEAITFKTKDFASLCKMDFLFPDRKVWDRPPVVGLDVMRHPRDPSILLLLLCFGIGCVILRFGAGEALPAPIHKFFADERIHFVGFGIPEKKDMFPFEALGLQKSKVDIGYLAVKILRDPKYKRWELAGLARKVLGIKRMIGLTEASSFERHERIKCAICQLFITSVIAMGLLGANDRKKTDCSLKKSSFLKNMNSLQLLAEGWFKLPKSKKRKQEPQDRAHVCVGRMDDVHTDSVLMNAKCEARPFVNCFFTEEIPEDDPKDYPSLAKIKVNVSEDDIYDAQVSKGDLGDCVAYEKDDGGAYVEDDCVAYVKNDCVAYIKEKEGNSSDDSLKGVSCTAKKPLKGILKCPSTTLLRSSSTPSNPGTPPSPSNSGTPPSPSTPTNPRAARDALKRANSKGYNVSFKFH